MKKKKIAIIGAGNAGCITALHFYKYLSESIGVSFEIEIYHSPHDHPIEKVGQGTIIQVPKMICKTTPNAITARPNSVSWRIQPNACAII